MSPFRDLTLSPVGLRVPARARYFLWCFNNSFISIPTVVSTAFWRLAQHWERDAVLSGSSVGLEYLLEDLCWVIEQGISPCILEDFGRVSGRVLEGFLQWQRKALRDCANPQGGDFRRSAISEKLSGFFWVS